MIPIAPERQMIYLRSFLFGIVAAVAASALWILAVFVLPIFVPVLLSRITGGGAGGAGASATSDSILGAGLVGFAAGFYWKFRKVSKAIA
jgi:hypothetical protein